MQDLRALLRQKRRTATAIPAFNYSDMWDLTALAAAAEQRGTPIMVAATPVVIRTLGMDLCQAMAAALTQRCTTPIYHHLDHSPSVEDCIRAVDLGFPSVMFDGSMRPLRENLELTRQVVAYAHRKGVAVEAEIGHMNPEAEGNGDGDAGQQTCLADPHEAEELARETGVDSLAVGIGTAHGVYRAEPKLRFNILERIAAKVEIPLVLHGGTGVPDSDIRRAITMGVSKVNVGTMIHLSYMNAVRRELQNAGPEPYTLDVMTRALADVRRVTLDRMDVIAPDCRQ